MTLLILTLAHSANASTQVHDNAASRLVRCITDSYLSLVAEVKNLHNPNEAANHSENSPCSSPKETIEIVIAGSKRPRDGMNGLERDDWDRLWSSGERMFGQAVREIGLSQFSRSAYETNGGIQSFANLIDFDDLPSQKQMAEVAFEEEKKLCREEDTKGTCFLERNVNEAVKMCLLALTRKESAPVGKAVVILPIDGCERLSEAEKQEIIETTNAVIKKCWQRRFNSGLPNDLRNNPLIETEVKILLVNANEQ